MAETRPINLALQGGGSHGAFTWGVLDRLLEDGRFTFAAVSGTSAGAMNAVALADGLARGGAEGARERLSSFWRAVGRKGRFSPVQRLPWDVFWGVWSIENSPSYIWYDAASRMVSPYLANPWNINPLQDVVRQEIDFDNVNRADGMKVFVTATNVESGQVKVFGRHEAVSLESVMASACLPHVFRSVEIDGVPYWDGGYGGNPAIFPFFHANAVEDVLLIQINPVIREGVPMTATEIQNRINEITFNSGLLDEFRAINFVKELIADGALSHDKYRDIRMHRIDADEAFKSLSASTKTYAEPGFLIYLRDLGREAAQDWLDSDARRVGSEPTLDLEHELKDHTHKPQMGPRVRQFMSTNAPPPALRVA